ncbi:hypothetical protein HSRCO_1624 [Halanaeroarchaeum sp. HSR-CO]|uniref:hypothetical protein n=1 Tax=Halanaeroarchaeum sp. HSR-CO TaxID=2866382 RepID=UPI00217D57C4|nr:hypothetical protein [Halanaeroarchaeum sp. HSR-CO]UWG47903.1 hypothetical protein HSRCO_1624 [Halanaeroarchaeum sp. HSR-CO]
MSEEIASVRGRVLEQDYRNIGEAVPETVMVTPGGDRFHLPDPTAEDQPMCSAKNYDVDFLDVHRQNAINSGFYACTTCFRPILVYLSISPDSPVERSEGFRDLSPDVDVPIREIGKDESGKNQSSGPFTEASVSSLTQEVLATSSTMHAPTKDGPLCGTSGSFRRVEPEKVEEFREPCGLCFDVEYDESEVERDVWKKSEA